MYMCSKIVCIRVCSVWGQHVSKMVVIYIATRTSVELCI